MNQESAQRISNELDAAIRNGDVDGIHRIIRDNPNWPPYNHWLAHPHDTATYSEFPVFRAFIEHFPETKDWDCNHLENLVGIAAINGDIPLLKYALEDLGHKANEGRYGYRPVLYTVDHMGEAVKNQAYAPGTPTCVKNQPEVMKILKHHGATLEGEPGDICYQRGHKKRNGKMCWHRDGKSNSPRCLWYFDGEEAPQRPGMLEQVKTLFSRERAAPLRTKEKATPSESREQLAPAVSEK